LRDFRKILKSGFMKIRPVGAEFFRADRRTARRDEANSCLSQFSQKRLE